MGLVDRYVMEIPHSKSTSSASLANPDPETFPITATLTAAESDIGECIGAFLPEALLFFVRQATENELFEGGASSFGEMVVEGVVTCRRGWTGGGWRG